ncbi:histidine kinase dimerization/phosphoacceptor domain -containing protein [Roseivirga sp. BDSF3-8]|uniref:tetratricopeptide repeat-containing sensor histidine kinase n=1 Tax=Roseivirga sp. BDSF3-8 TaxID=3241598 RepID=UPI0035320949
MAVLRIFSYSSFLGLCLLLVGAGYRAEGRQQPQIDSLLYTLEATGGDSVRQVICSELAWEYSYVSADTGLLYARQALALAEDLKDTVALATAWGMMGINLDIMGIQDKAIEAHFNSLTLWKVLKDETQQSIALNNIGIIYSQRKEYHKAMPYLMDALAIDRQMGETLNEAGSLVNIGIIYHKMHKPDSALMYYNEGLALQLEIEDSTHLSVTYVSIGNIYLDWQQLDTAESYFLTAMTLNGEHINPQYNTTITGNLSHIYILRKNYTKALEYASKALDMARKSNTLRDEMEALYYQVEAYEHLGEPAQALAAHKQYASIRDSLNNLETSRQIHEIENRYKVNEKEQQIALLHTTTQLQQARISQQARSTRYLVVLALLGAAGALTGLVLYRTKKQHAQTLDEKNKLISRALGEKEVLMKEIHHRVKNNLQIVSSLLFLQSQHVENVQARHAINEGRNRVKSMALLHQKLYQGSDLRAVNILEYTHNLVANLQECYPEPLANIAIAIQVPDTELDVDATIPLGLIINELVTNAIKHGFEKGQPGCIEILLQTEDGEYHLSVRDNGRGLPPDFDMDKAGSFGMSLVQALAKKLNACRTITDNGGVCVTLTFPTPMNDTI